MISDYYTENALSVKFYDVVTSIDPAVKDDVDVDYYEGYLPSPDQKTLDIGCGAGRVSIALAARGHHVIGVDNSAAMLNRARSKCQRLAPTQLRNIQFVHCDMQTLELPVRFDLVIVSYYTFNHLKNRYLRAQCLATIAKHLLPGARAVIHAASPERMREPRALRKGVFQIWGSPDSKQPRARLEVTWRPADINEKEQSLSQVVAYELFERDGASVAASEERLKLWWFSDAELDILVRDAGLERQQTLTSFRSEQGYERIYVLRKPL